MPAPITPICRAPPSTPVLAAMLLPPRQPRIRMAGSIMARNRRNVTVAGMGFG